MKNLRNFKITTFSFLTLLTLSCSKDDEVVPPPTNEEELITTVKVTLTNGANTIVITSKDLDGDGATAPVITKTGNIIASTAYVGKVEFLNEAKNPAEDITAEVLAEDKDHQVFYQATTALGTFTYNDLDVNGKPIGLKFNYTAGLTNSNNNNLIVTLRHLPNKSASGVATGDITNAGGATDAAVTFPLTIQ
jgi:hypothetical protein